MLEIHIGFFRFDEELICISKKRFTVLNAIILMPVLGRECVSLCLMRNRVSEI